MDDGWEMSDGVQAKVPIRGQPEGGVSPTGANERRLEEPAAVATRSAPPPQPKPCEVLHFSSALHFLSHTQHPRVTFLRPARDRPCTQCVTLHVCL